MTIFELHLESPTQYEKIASLISFVGEDASGKFGILANHTRMMTCLSLGLARFTYGDHVVEYVALQGGVLYFRNNQLHISTRHYIRDTDYKNLQKRMEEEMQVEEDNLRSLRVSLRRLDEEMLKHLLKLKRWGNYEI